MMELQRKAVRQDQAEGSNIVAAGTVVGNTLDFVDMGGVGKAGRVLHVRVFGIMAYLPKPDLGAMDDVSVDNLLGPEDMGGC